MLRSRHFISKQNDPTCHSVTAFLILNQHIETKNKSFYVEMSTPNKIFCYASPSWKALFF